MLSWAVNEKFIGRRVTSFNVAVTLQEILYRILKYAAASVISTVLVRGGHLVTIAGFSTVQRVDSITAPGDIDIDAVRRVYLLDSWGDWTLGYERGSSGFGVALSVEEIMTYAKPTGQARKWAHLFSRDGTF